MKLESMSLEFGAELGIVIFLAILAAFLVVHVARS